jgi:asparagine synthase (glutamine-hydrolysing)
MCGILLVKSKHSIPTAQHLQALSKLNSRGPDFARYRNTGNTFVGQTVLHITGNRDYYQAKQENFLAYNGEIYNYCELGNYSNDIEFVHDAVEQDITKLHQGWGPWAWAWTNGQTVRYASDPQGERCLYQYQDDSILIVCSEVAPILEYVGRNSVELPYQNKLWTMLDQTVWKDINKIEPGQLYQDGQAVQTIDSVWSWIKPVKYNNINEAYEEFQSQWQTVTQLMTPTCPAALTYSGGLDSSIILSHIDNLELYSVNCTGKDPIVDRIREFLTAEEQSRLHEFNINEAQWANEFQQLMARTCMPAQSWSHVGQWIVNRNCEQRVLFTGCGADELFGGYDVYRDLTYDVTGSFSPYSKNGDPAIWQRCLDVYNGDPQQATLLMDYWYQVVGCDVRGVDVIGGAWGIEPRNPFLAQPIMQLALNLPFEFKVGTVSKPMIRQLFLKRWSQDLILPKKGFTGHANDSLPYLPITIESTGDRLEDWKQIVQQSFYDSNS